MMKNNNSKIIKINKMEGGETTMDNFKDNLLMLKAIAEASKTLYSNNTDTILNYLLKYGTYVAESGNYKYESKTLGTFSTRHSKSETTNAEQIQQNIAEIAKSQAKIRALEAANKELAKAPTEIYQKDKYGIVATLSNAAKAEAMAILNSIMQEDFTSKRLQKQTAAKKTKDEITK